MFEYWMIVHSVPGDIAAFILVIFLFWVTTCLLTIWNFFTVWNMNASTRTELARLKSIEEEIKKLNERMSNLESIIKLQNVTMAEKREEAKAQKHMPVSAGRVTKRVRPKIAINPSVITQSSSDESNDVKIPNPIRNPIPFATSAPSMNDPDYLFGGTFEDLTKFQSTSKHNE